MAEAPPQSGNHHTPPRHLRINAPSPWIVRFAPLIKKGGTVLDLAAGGGRHSRHLVSLGLKVTAVDKSVEPLAGIDAEIITADLEDGGPWPFEGRTFDGIVVTNYLYRPTLENLIANLAPGGVLIYETFARGNEQFARPRNPDHLLKSGELLELVRGRLQVVAYEHGQKDSQPLPGVVQRSCAVNELATDGEEPPFHRTTPDRTREVVEMKGE